MFVRRPKKCALVTCVLHTYSHALAVPSQGTILRECPGETIKVLTHLTSRKIGKIEQSQNVRFDLFLLCRFVLIFGNRTVFVVCLRHTQSFLCSLHPSRLCKQHTDGTEVPGPNRLTRPPTPVHHSSFFLPVHQCPRVFRECTGLKGGSFPTTHVPTSSVRSRRCRERGGLIDPMEPSQ